MIVSVPFAPLIVVTPEVSGVEIGRGSAVPVFSATRGITGIVEVVFFWKEFFPSQAYAAQVMHGQVRWVLWWQKKYGLYLARHRQGYPVASRLRLRSEKMNEAQRACD